MIRRSPTRSESLLSAGWLAHRGTTVCSKSGRKSAKSQNKDTDFTSGGAYEDAGIEVVKMSKSMIRLNMKSWKPGMVTDFRFGQISTALKQPEGKLLFVARNRLFGTFHCMPYIRTAWWRSPHYWPFLRGIQRPLASSFNFSLLLAWMYCWNNTRRYRWFQKPWCRCDVITLRWRHNEQDGVSNHQPYHCLLNCLVRRRSKKTSKLRVTGLCARNSPGTGEFPAQMASNAENVSIWWRHHDNALMMDRLRARERKWRIVAEILRTNSTLLWSFKTRKIGITILKQYRIPSLEMCTYIFCSNGSRRLWKEIIQMT